ncbi:MAG: protein phosphatase 2C domain-containing protein [Treponema sp.]|jgi:serine/threonine protein phosphatase PrpC|nr:protein phosphatase 2C domain-containing protein [Treponema sp.]
MNKYKSFAVTVIGGSHIKHGKGCEDSSTMYDDEGVSIAVVADGHGDDNCFRSARGAKFAVACAAKGIQEFVKYLDEPEETEPNEKMNIIKWLLRKPATVLQRESLLKKEEAQAVLKEKLIEQGIIRAWFKITTEDYTNNPITEEELKNVGDKYRKRYTEGTDLHHAYGATLIAAAITPYYWFGIHIGDGRFTALYADGTFDQPVPWDDKCYLNVTTSICDDDAAVQARCYFSFHELKTPPVAVFLCSDGIDDNYPVDENEKHLYKLYRTIALTFAEDGFESTYKQLIDLANQFATKGKGDDTSIAGFINMEVLKKAVPIWKKQIAEEESVLEKTTAENTAKEETQAESKLEKLEQAALEYAASEYEKNTVSQKDDISSYGDFLFSKLKKGKK